MKRKAARQGAASRCWIGQPEIGKLVFLMHALLKRTVYRVEHGVQVAAKAIDRSNDRERNARCDQTVFDGGSAIFVSEEFCKHRLHLYRPLTVRVKIKFRMEDHD